MNNLKYKFKRLSKSKMIILLAVLVVALFASLSIYRYFAASVLNGANESSITATTVYINDRVSDYDYYMSLNRTTITTVSEPSGEDTNRYNDSNLIPITINYYGYPYGQEDNTFARGKVSPTEGQYIYTYYKYVVRDENYATFELIDNPFSSRPDGYGFAGWTTDYEFEGDVPSFNFDQETLTETLSIPVDVSSNDEITVNLYATWAPANVQRTSDRGSSREQIAATYNNFDVAYQAKAIPMAEVRTHYYLQNQQNDITADGAWFILASVNQLNVGDPYPNDAIRVETYQSGTVWNNQTHTNDPVYTTVPMRVSDYNYPQSDKYCTQEAKNNGYDGCRYYKLVTPDDIISNVALYRWSRSQSRMNRADRNGLYKDQEKVIGYRLNVPDNFSLVGLYKKTNTMSYDQNGDPYEMYNGTNLTKCTNGCWDRYHRITPLDDVSEQFYTNPTDENGFAGMYTSNTPVYYYKTSRETNIYLVNTTGSFFNDYVDQVPTNKPVVLTTSAFGTAIPNSGIQYNWNNYRVGFSGDIKVENMNFANRNDNSNYVKTNYATADDYRANTIRQVEENNNWYPNVTHSWFFNYHNVKIGRNVTAQGNMVSPYVYSGTYDTVNRNETHSKAYVESGKYGVISNGGDTRTNGDAVLAYSTLTTGNDYDRVNGNTGNSKLKIYYLLAASIAGKYGNGSNTDKITPRSVMIAKSGEYGLNAAGTAYQNAYMSGIYAGAIWRSDVLTTRELIVEGGRINVINGGPLVNEGFALNEGASQTYNATTIRFKGGTARFIFGGAGVSATVGNRIVSVTGGTVYNNVFGGSNSYRSQTNSGQGILKGTTLLYIGGHSHIGGGNTTNTNGICVADIGSVFGAGAGNAQYQDLGKVVSSHVIIDGDAVIEGDAYLGGNYGTTGSIFATSTSTMDILGGTINGNAYGSSNNRGAGLKGQEALTENVARLDYYYNVYTVALGGTIPAGSWLYNGSKTETNITCTANSPYYYGSGCDYALNKVSKGDSLTFEEANMNIYSLYLPHDTIHKFTAEYDWAVNKFWDTITSYGDATKINVNLNGGTVVGNIYGASNTSGITYGIITVNLLKGTAGGAFGGGRGAATMVDSNVYVNSDTTNDNDLVVGNVYGGSEYGIVNFSSEDNNYTVAKTAKKTRVTINGGTFTNVFAGSKGGPGGTPTIAGTATLTVTDGKITNAYGGNNLGGNLLNSSYVFLRGGEITTAYGGSYQSDIESSYIKVEDGATVGDLFGGNNESGTSTLTHVNVTGGTITNNVYGGNNAGGIARNTYVFITGGTFSSSKGIYGCGKGAATRCVNTHVDIDADAPGSVYGGGEEASVHNTAQNAKTLVNIRSGNVGSVFGGSNTNGTVDNSYIYTTGEVVVNNVYGGNNVGGTAANPNVYIGGGTITNVYGGGKQVYTGDTYIELISGTTTNVYGGGEEAGAGTTVVDVVGGTHTNVFGGSNISGEVSTTTVNLGAQYTEPPYLGDNSDSTASADDPEEDDPISDNLTEHLTNKENHTNEGVSTGDLVNNSYTKTVRYGDLELTYTISNIQYNIWQSVGDSETYNSASNVTISIHNTSTTKGYAMPDVVIYSHDSQINKQSYYHTNVEWTGISHGGHEGYWIANDTYTNSKDSPTYMCQYFNDHPTEYINYVHNTDHRAWTGYSACVTRFGEPTNYVFISPGATVNITNPNFFIYSKELPINYYIKVDFADNWYDTDKIDELQNGDINHEEDEEDINKVKFIIPDMPQADLEQVTQAFGGNNAGGSATVAVVNVLDDARNIDTVYGGGNNAESTYSYARGYGGTVNTAIYGGGKGAGAVVTGSSLAFMNGTTTTNVYGGGNQGNVTGNSYVALVGSTINGSVFASGNAAMTGAEGGSSTSRVDVISGTIAGNIYGGANSSKVNGYTQVFIGNVVDYTGNGNLMNPYTKDIEIGGTIFGGSEMNASMDEHYDFTAISVTKGVDIRLDGTNYNINIAGSIFGSGNASSIASDATSDILITNYGTSSNVERLLSLQRATNVKINNSHILIKGTSDSTNQYNATLFALNRIENLYMLNNTELFLAKGANLLLNIYSGYYDQNDNFVKETANITNIGTVTKNTDNKLYMSIMTAQDDTLNVLNVLKTETVNTDATGEVHGMAFLGMYSENSEGVINKGMYNTSYLTGSTASNADVNMFDAQGTYVLGKHYYAANGDPSDHNIKVDGYYTNYVDENNRIKVDYVIPTPNGDKESNYYFWRLGEDIRIYTVTLEASRFSTFGAKDLSLLDLSANGSYYLVDSFSATDATLNSDVSIIDKASVPKIAASSDIANSQFGLAFGTSSTGWASKEETDLYSAEPTIHSRDSGDIYKTDNTNNTSVLEFYLYHSKNVSLTDEEIEAGGKDLGYGILKLQFYEYQEGAPVLIPKEINIRIKLRIITGDENGYASSITPGKKYHTFPSKLTNISSKSSFSIYESMLIRFNDPNYVQVKGQDGAPDQLFTKESLYGSGYSNHRALRSGINLPVGTTITMLDLRTNEYYYYNITQEVYNQKASSFTSGDYLYYLRDFTKMASTSTNNKYNDAAMTARYLDSDADGELTLEEFIFQVDFVDTNIVNNINKQLFYLELEKDNGPVHDIVVMKPLGSQGDSMVYSVYTDVTNGLVTTGSLDKTSIYSGETVNMTLNTQSNNGSSGGVSVTDTTYNEYKLGTKISVYNSDGTMLTGADLLGLSFTIDGVTYYPRIDGTVRINLAGRASTITSNIAIDTENATLPSDTYKFVVETFGSYDGLYYGDKDVNKIELTLNVLNSRYGLDVTIPDSEVIHEYTNGADENGNNTLDFDIKLKSGLANGNLRVALYRRDYNTEFERTYTLVDLQDYVTDTLTVKDAAKKEYVVRDTIAQTATDDVTEINDFTLTLKDTQLQTGTYRVVFSIYDNNEFIGNVYQYIIIRDML